MLLAAGLLSACNPFAADPKVAILGRWESPTWTRSQRPLFAQFKPDGKIEFMDAMASTMYAEWLFLQSGELQITYPAGFSRRCKATIAGSSLTIEPPKCLYGWDDVGPSIALVKQ
ncbi:hypothetical protein MesoLj131b_76940 (plasmid) [Mesorhizobium sp. 131-2-5]|uniref:hypothetical protein n=1 Tax=Mesorhizobium sp. 131-2-5 TaxID=2744519 RepID=UPI0018EAD49D|nr:hypothetical protein [Mesorhizobium sp. 131-2-5]BCH05695.1 hypothetical protein MesoLj131b_76940 [Mesorhizobium sp. 131-2-5]